MSVCLLADCMPRQVTQAAATRSNLWVVVLPTQARHRCVAPLPPPLGSSSFARWPLIYTLSFYFVPFLCTTPRPIPLPHITAPLQVYAVPARGAHCTAICTAFLRFASTSVAQSCALQTRLVPLLASLHIVSLPPLYVTLPGRRVPTAYLFAFGFDLSRLCSAASRMPPLCSTLREPHSVAACTSLPARSPHPSVRALAFWPQHAASWLSVDCLVTIARCKTNTVTISHYYYY